MRRSRSQAHAELCIHTYRASQVVVQKQRSAALHRLSTTMNLSRQLSFMWSPRAAAEQLNGGACLSLGWARAYGTPTRTVLSNGVESSCLKCRNTPSPPIPQHGTYRSCITQYGKMDCGKGSGKVTLS